MQWFRRALAPPEENEQFDELIKLGRVHASIWLERQTEDHRPTPTHIEGYPEA